MTCTPWEALAAAGHAGTDDELVLARRSLAIFGRDFELCYLPSRRERSGVPSASRPSFAPHPGERIRHDEVLWSRGRLVATPNRYPFMAPSMLLWEASGSAREVTEAFLVEAFALCDQLAATLVANTVGASASIPLAHAHLLGPKRSLLAAQESQAWPLVELAGDAELRLMASDPQAGWPLHAAVIDAPDPERRARAVRCLLDQRRHAAANLMLQGSRAFVVPRREEMGGAAFPYAIGAGELSGRFIFPDRQAFREAHSEGLETALARACVASCDAENESLRQLFLRL